MENLNNALLDVLSGRLTPTVFSNLQNLPGGTKESVGNWLDSGGTTADSNPATAQIPHGVAKWTSGLVKAYLSFSPAAAWDNLFWYTKLPLPTVMPLHMAHTATFSFTEADLAGLTAFERQSELTFGGYTYNHAYQLLFGKGWRYFDFVRKAWVMVPGIPLPNPLTVNAVLAEATLDPIGHTVTHEALWINGLRYSVGVTIEAPSTKNADKYTVAVQLDSVGAAKGQKPPACGVTLSFVEARYLTE